MWATFELDAERELLDSRGLCSVSLLLNADKLQKTSFGEFDLA